MHVGNKESTELFCTVLERHRWDSRTCSIPNLFVNAFHCRTMTAIINAGDSSRFQFTALSRQDDIAPRDDSADSRRSPICIAVTIIMPASIVIAIAGFAAIRSLRRTRPISRGRLVRPLCGIDNYAADTLRSTFELIIRTTKSCSASLPRALPSCRSLII